MEKNIHRETFEEILNYKSKGIINPVFETSNNVTFKNFGKIFDYSAMCEKMLPSNAEINQKYVESDDNLQFLRFFDFPFITK